MRGPNRSYLWQRMTAFFSEVITELRKVLWPGKNDVVSYSSGVVGVVFIVAALIWILDWAFRNLTLALGLYSKG